jgi:hypothetical protein
VTRTESWAMLRKVFEVKCHCTFSGRFSLTAAVMQSSFVALLVALDTSRVRYHLSVNENVWEG